MDFGKPVFLFAFANNSDRYLAELSKEERAARERLQHAHDSGRLEFMTMGCATVDDVFRAFNRFHNRVFLFHYGGHSDHGFLDLADRKARASGLARLMGMQKNLRLVFLNGCSNREQVSALLEAGVPAVIATSAPVDDQQARLLAHQFYEALAGGKSLRDAFETAAAYVNNEAPELEINFRAASFEGETDSSGFPWGLYAQEEQALDWVLPAPVSAAVPDEWEAEVELSLPDVNKKLVERTFEGMVALSPETWQAMQQMYKAQPSGMAFNFLQNAILDAFPSILSTAVRDLFTHEGTNNGRLRLKFIRTAYIILSRLICNVALANIWEAFINHRTEKEEHPFIIREEYRKDLKDYITLSPAAFEQQDFLWLAGTCGRIMEENEFEPFISEMKSLWENLAEADDFYSAYRFMEQELRMNWGKIPAAEVERICEEAEGHLGTLLKYCAFLGVYQLITVKNINVYKLRGVPNPYFVHQKATLRGRDYETLDKEPVFRHAFTCHNSVVLVRDMTAEDPLELTPFLMDENSFKNKEGHLPKIYFFNGRPDEKTLEFTHVENPEERLQVGEDYDKRKYQDLDLILKQMELFIKELELANDG
jgi:hypothetical protein